MLILYEREAREPLLTKIRGGLCPWWLRKGGQNLALESRARGSCSIFAALETTSLHKESGRRLFLCPPTAHWLFFVRWYEPTDLNLSNSTLTTLQVFILGINFPENRLVKVCHDCTYLYHDLR